MQPTAAVAVIHAQRSDAVLLIRRPLRDTDPWSGHWAVPGGRREAEDEDLLATAVRETAEECAIDLPRARARPLPEALAGRSVGRPVAVAPFLFELPDQAPVTPEPGEVAGYRWLPVHRLRDLAEHRVGPVRHRRGEERWPHLVVDGAPLWGFTYRVLCDWLEIDAPFGLRGD